MNKLKVLIPLFFLFLAGCAAEDSLTKEEMAIQSAADYEVASLLFDKDLSANASYNVRSDGFVVIAFDKSVSESAYQDVVDVLRSRKAIKGVRAEQEGIEVCPLR